MKEAAALTVVVLVACGSPTNTASHSHTTATPSTATLQTLTGLPSCRLPYVREQAGLEPGFITLPNDTFQSDPSSAVVTTAASDGRVQTVSTPVLIGNGPMSFDWAMRRWIPADLDLFSPNGIQYAYSEYIPNSAAVGPGGPGPLGTRVHLVDIGTGKDLAVYETKDVVYTVAWKPEGIYLAEPFGATDTGIKPFYLQLLNLSTNSTSRLLGGSPVDMPYRGFGIGNGVLWVVDADPAADIDPNRLVSVNLVDGARTIVFEKSDYSMQFVGLTLNFDPVVLISKSFPDYTGSTWLISGLDSATMIAPSVYTQMLADSHGIWLGMVGPTIALYSPDGAIHNASSPPGYFAGPCE